MKRPKPFTVFVAELARAKRPEYSGPGNVAQDAEALRALARALDKLSTRKANGYGWGDRLQGYDYPTKAASDLQRSRDERNEPLLLARARCVAEKYGFATYYQTDPRGLPIYLGYEGHMTDRNYSTTGIGVPL